MVKACLTRRAVFPGREIEQREGAQHVRGNDRLGRREEGGIQLLERGGAEQAEAGDDLRLEYFQHPQDARLPSATHPVADETPDSDAGGAAGDRLHDVRTAADAAV